MRLLKIFLAMLLMLNYLSFAVSFNIDGYYRVRGDLFHQLDLNSDYFGGTRSYWDQRFRLNPELIVTDYISIKSQFDILDNELFGQNPRDPSVTLNPNFYQSDPSDATNPPTEVQDNSYDTVGFSGGQTNAYIAVKRVWAEIVSPVAVLKVGRQPSHFGLGIAENSGDGPFDDFGDNEDRIMFETGYKGLVLSSGYDKEVETDETVQEVLREEGLDNSADDVQRWFIKAGYDKEEFKLLSLISKRWQNAADINAWNFDFFGNYKINIFELSGEFLMVHGGAGDKNISAYNGAGRFSGILKFWDFGLESGISSGTKDSITNTASLATIPFDKDYNISYILFQEALPGGAGFNTQDPTDQDIASTERHAGAISNAIYWRFYTGFTIAKQFRLGTNVLAAITHRDPAIGFNPDNLSEILFSRSKYYGLEYSILLNYDISEHFHCNFTFAHFIPGGVYNDQQQALYPQPTSNSAEQALAVLGGLRITF